MKTTPAVAAAPPGREKPTVLEHARSLVPLLVCTTLTWSVFTDGCSRKSCIAGSPCNFVVSSAAGSDQRPLAAEAPRLSTAHRVRWSRRGSDMYAFATYPRGRAAPLELSIGGVSVVRLLPSDGWHYVTCFGR